MTSKYCIDCSHFYFDPIDYDKPLFIGCDERIWNANLIKYEADFRTAMKLANKCPKFNYLSEVEPGLTNSGIGKPKK